MIKTISGHRLLWFVFSQGNKVKAGDGWHMTGLVEDPDMTNSSPRVGRLLMSMKEHHISVETNSAYSKMVIRTSCLLFYALSSKAGLW